DIYSGCCVSAVKLTPAPRSSDHKPTAIVSIVARKPRTTEYRTLKPRKAPCISSVRSKTSSSAAWFRSARSTAGGGCRAMATRMRAREERYSAAMRSISALAAAMLNISCTRMARMHRQRNTIHRGTHEEAEAAITLFRTNTHRMTTRLARPADMYVSSEAHALAREKCSGT
ncbi:hypothetical protein DFJ74DRAFT_682926, partial [Hyaloraphidium curvatum]